MSHHTKHSTFVVKSAADTGPATLRAGILYANAHANTTITFAPKVHKITLSHELPEILGSGTVIDGHGHGKHGNVTIDGASKFRDIAVGDATHRVSVTIENLTISHGLAQGGNGGTGGGGGAGLGGGLFVTKLASVTLINDVFSGNLAEGGNGGGIGSFAGGGGGMGGQRRCGGIWQ